MHQTAPNVEEIFLAALEIEGPEARSSYLDRVCGDPGLRHHVERLLALDARAHGFLESPASPLPATADSHHVLESPGTVIGPYKLMEQIGEGGMGAVYVAEQTKPVRRRVALKIIKPGMDTRQVVARFEVERQALAMMDHPNIAKVYDGGSTESGRPYFVMELVRGIPITDYCDREQLAIPERLELFVLVCRAVQHAHQKGIIHRDLKPSNILVTVIDGAAVPKIIDFGVAKATGASLTDRTVYTAFHQFVGTPLYMSPEQLDLAGMDMDTRSDIYSLGVLLYELLTGTTPFDQHRLRQAAFDELRRIIREEEPPRPSTRLSSLGATRTAVSANRKAEARHLDRTIRGELDWIAMKALEKDRRRRYQTANDFAADLMRYLTHQPVEACPPSGWYRLAKYARRNRAFFTTSAVVALALVTGTAVATWQAIRATRASRVAKEQRELAGKREKVAEDAAAEARQAAAESKAILTFLVHDMLALDPERGGGRDVKFAQVLDNAEKKIDTSFRNQPLVEAGVRYAIGSARNGMWQFDLASRHLSRSYELRRDLLGLEHPDTLASMANLGWALRWQKTVESLNLLEQALEIRRRTLGPEHPDTLQSMFYLGFMLAWQEKTDEARKIFEQMLEIQRRVLGPEHRDTLTTIPHLATTLDKQGKTDEALKLSEQTLEIQRRVLGPEHPDTLLAMGILGSVLLDHGKLDEARKFVEDAVQISRRVMGVDHPAREWLMKLIAQILNAQGKKDELCKLYEEELEYQRRTLGREHPKTLAAMDAVANLLRQEGKTNEARKLHEEIVEVKRRVLESARRSLGPEHPVTLEAMHKVGDAFLELGKVNEARALREQILEIQRRTLGQDHPDTLKTLAQLGVDYLWAHKPAEAAPLFEDALRRAGGRIEALAKLKEVPGVLADAYKQSGQFDKAEPLLREQLARHRADYGQGAQIHGALAALGPVLIQQRKFAEAEPLLRDCLVIRAKTLPDNWYLFNAKSMLGEALLGQRKLGEAEPLVLQGYEGLKARAATIPVRFRQLRLSEAAARVVRLCAALNQPGKADRLLRSEDRDALMPNGIAAFATLTTGSDEVASP
jgi:serine/threonine protein kinase/TolA-binding protein